MMNSDEEEEGKPSPQPPVRLIFDSSGEEETNEDLFPRGCFKFFPAGEVGRRSTANEIVTRLLYFIVQNIFKLNPRVKEAYDAIKTEQLGYRTSTEPHTDPMTAASSEFHRVLSSRGVDYKSLHRDLSRQKKGESDDRSYRDCITDEDRKTLKDVIPRFGENLFHLKIINIYELFALPKLLSRLIKFSTGTKFLQGRDQFKLIFIATPKFLPLPDGDAINLEFIYDVNFNHNSQIKVQGLEEYYYIFSQQASIDRLPIISSLIKTIMTDHQLREKEMQIVHDDKDLSEGLLKLFLVEASRNLISLFLFPMGIDLIQRNPQRVIDELTEVNKTASKKRKKDTGDIRRTAEDEEELEQEVTEASKAKREEIVMHYFPMAEAGATGVSRSSLFTPLDYGTHGANFTIKNQLVKKFIASIADQVCRWGEFENSKKGEEVCQLRTFVDSYRPSIDTSQLRKLSYDDTLSLFTKSMTAEKAKFKEVFLKFFEENQRSDGAKTVAINKMTINAMITHYSKLKRLKHTEDTKQEEHNIQELKSFLGETARVLTTKNPGENFDLLLHSAMHELLIMLNEKCSDFYGVEGMLDFALESWGEVKEIIDASYAPDVVIMGGEGGLAAAEEC